VGEWEDPLHHRLYLAYWSYRQRTEGQSGQVPKMQIFPPCKNIAHQGNLHYCSKLALEKGNLVLSRSSNEGPMSMVRAECQGGLYLQALKTSPLLNGWPSGEPVWARRIDYDLDTSFRSYVKVFNPF
jgi:hypothetical protein